MLGSVRRGLALESQLWCELRSLAVPAAMEVAGMSVP